MSVRAMTLGALLLMTTLAGAQARAQGPWEGRRFVITAGSFLHTSDTTIRIDGEYLGTSIDVENVLGVDTTSSLSRFSGRWHFADRHSFSFGYYGLHREASKQITDEIIFDDVVYPVDALVESRLKLDFYEFGYTYWLVLNEKNRFGLTGGVVAVSISAALRAELQGGGSAEVSGRATTDLPVVMVGVSYRRKLGKNFLLVAEEAFLPRISYDNYGGSALNLGLALEYEFLDHYAVGAAWDEFRIEFEAKGERAVGKFEYDISGPQAYFKVFW